MRLRCVNESSEVRVQLVCTWIYKNDHPQNTTNTIRLHVTPVSIHGMMTVVGYPVRGYSIESQKSTDQSQYNEHTNKRQVYRWNFRGFRTATVT